MLKKMRNWREAVMTADAVSYQDRIHILFIGESMDWSSGIKTFNSEDHMQNWLAGVSKRFKTTRSKIADGLAAGLDCGLFVIAKDEIAASLNAETVLIRSGGDKDE